MYYSLAPALAAALVLPVHAATSQVAQDGGSERTPSRVSISKIKAGERTLGAEIPFIIERLQMEAEELDRVASTVNERFVEVILDRGAHPWAILAEEEFGNLTSTPRAAAIWANAAREALALSDYELQPAGVHDFVIGRTIEFSLSYDGLPVFGSSMNLHWSEGRFQGATVSAPRQLGVVDPVPANVTVERAYVPYGRADGGTDLAVAAVLRRFEDGHRKITYMPSGHPTFHVVKHGPVQEHPGPAAAAAALSSLPLQTDLDPSPPFQQWIPPMTTFPDQMGVSSDGNVWVSAPNSDLILRLRRNTGTWQTVATGNNTGPDGLMVDANDEVWFGAFYSRQFGRYNPATAALDYYAPPVSVSNMAVPNKTVSGNVVVTDHGGWLMEFDPVTETWVDFDHTLAASPHLVVATEDTVNQELVMTQFFVRRLGFRPVAGGSIVDVSIPGSGSPAFLEAIGGTTWFSIWDRNQLGEYDPSNGQFTFHDYPLGGGEVGGPMDVTPNGNVVSGTRGSGFITVFRPAENRFDAYAIPSGFPGLKDGLRVAEDGVVWFTESSANRVSRLRYLR